MTEHQQEIWLRSAIARISGTPADTVPKDADLQEAVGLDSLGRLELLSEVEDEFDLYFDDAPMVETLTIDDMLSAIDAKLGEKQKEGQPCASACLH